MDHCHGFPTPTKVEEPLGTDANGSEAKKYWYNSYASVIGIMLYLASNIRPYIFLVIHQCNRFTNNTKASYYMAVKRICRYLQGTKDNDIVFNSSNKLVADFYADADSAVLWGHENPQYHICDTNRTGYVVAFTNCPILWVSKIHTDIYLSTIHSKYLALSSFARALLPL